MKAAIRSILKGVEKVTDICSDILTYEIRNGYSMRGNDGHFLLNGTFVQEFYVFFL